MYTIKRAAELAGLSTSTVRAWERRYGIPNPGRTESRYRVYSATDVELLCRMSALVRGGVPPSQAASRVIGTAGDLEPDLTPAGFVERVAAGDTPEGELQAVLRAAEAHRAWARVADDWLMPMLVELGRAWRRGEVSLLREHEVSVVVMQHLLEAYHRAVPEPDGTVVVLGLPPGERHEIGLLLFAVLLRLSGMRAHYLGTDLSVEDWLAAAAQYEAVLLVTALHRDDDGATQRLVDQLVDAGRRVAIGGGHQDDVDRAERLGHHFATAAHRVASIPGAPG